MGPEGWNWGSDIPRKHLGRTWGNLLVPHSRHLMLGTYISVLPSDHVQMGLVLSRSAKKLQWNLKILWPSKWYVVVVLQYCRWYPRWILVDVYFSASVKKLINFFSPRNTNIIIITALVRTVSRMQNSFKVSICTCRCNFMFFFLSLTVLEQQMFVSPICETPMTVNFMWAITVAYLTLMIERPSRWQCTYWMWHHRISPPIGCSQTIYSRPCRSKFEPVLHTSVPRKTWSSYESLWSFRKAVSCCRFELLCLQE